MSSSVYFLYIFSVVVVFQVVNLWTGSTVFYCFRFFLCSQLLTQKRRLFSFEPQTFRFSVNFSRFAYMRKSDFLTESYFAFVKKAIYPFVCFNFFSSGVDIYPFFSNSIEKLFGTPRQTLFVLNPHIFHLVY